MIQIMIQTSVGTDETVNLVIETCITFTFGQQLQLYKIISFNYSIVRTFVKIAIFGRLQEHLADTWHLSIARHTMNVIAST